MLKANLKITKRHSRKQLPQAIVNGLQGVFICTSNTSFRFQIATEGSVMRGNRHNSNLINVSATRIDQVGSLHHSIYRKDVHIFHNVMSSPQQTNKRKYVKILSN